jgi:hypothetical protein
VRSAGASHIAVGGVPELPTLQVFDAVDAQLRGAPVPAH